MAVKLIRPYEHGGGRGTEARIASDRIVHVEDWGDEQGVLLDWSMDPKEITRACFLRLAHPSSTDRVRIGRGGNLRPTGLRGRLLGAFATTRIGSEVHIDYEATSVVWAPAGEGIPASIGVRATDWATAESLARRLDAPDVADSLPELIPLTQ